MPKWLTIILFNLATFALIALCAHLVLNYAVHLKIGLLMVLVAIAIIVVIGGTFTIIDNN